MCTLIVARNVFPSFPLVIVANRDEYLARPASPPKVIHGLDENIMSPRDEQRGGTWIGVSSLGIVAAITNRHDVTSVPGRNSRGELPFRALRIKNARAAEKDFAATAGSAYNGFHLVAADRRDACLIKGDGKRTTTSLLPDGVHVITQFGTAPDHHVRAAVVGPWLERMAAAGMAPHPRTLEALLTSHRSGLDGTCVHMPEKGYGTRSSTIIRVYEDGRGADYWHREGHACSGPFGPKIRFPFRKA